MKSTCTNPVRRTSALLLVEDEAAPRKVMAQNLTRVWDVTGGMPVLSFASFINLAIRWLRTRPFDLVSMDMRMPSEQGAEIQASTGINFAAHPVATTMLSKPIVFSSTIEVEVAKEKLREALEVAGAPIADKYAKSERTFPPNAEIPFESLTYLDWAKRINEYLEGTGKSFSTPGGTRLTSVGNWLTVAQRVLPPLLARHVTWMDRHWEDHSAPPLDAAHRFIEICERLALAQTAVVLQAAGVNTTELTAPSAWQRKGVQDTLSAWRGQLALLSAQRGESWNWLNWLTEESIDAMTQARELRNERAHGLAMAKPAQDWRKLYQPIRCIMDMASYWAMHPMCTGCQFGRDGARAQLVASTELPLPFRHLDPDIAVPFEAEGDVGTCWQPLWRASGNGRPLDENTPPVWTSVMASWQHWIERDSAGAVWLKLWSKPGLIERLDLISGETRRDSGA